MAAIDLAFQDVYGNRTISSAALPPVKATLGYTDPLIGPTSWPGLAAGYEFLPGPGNSIHLNTLLQLRLEPYSPGAGVDAPAALRQASADAERYKQIYYQQAQPDVSFELSTNLGTVTANNARPAFTEFGANAYVYLETASQLETVEATTPGGGTLTSLGTKYSLTPSNSQLPIPPNRRAVKTRPITIPQLRASRAAFALSRRSVKPPASPDRFARRPQLRFRPFRLARMDCVKWPPDQWVSRRPPDTSVWARRR